MRIISSRNKNSQATTSSKAMLSVTSSFFLLLSVIVALPHSSIATTTSSSVDQANARANDNGIDSSLQEDFQQQQQHVLAKEHDGNILNDEFNDDELITMSDGVHLPPTISPPSLSKTDDQNSEDNADLPIVSNSQSLDKSETSTAIDSNVIYSTAVELDGTFLGHLKIVQGQEPIDAIYEFCKHHEPLHNNALAREGLLTRACGSGSIKCTRRTPVVYSVLVQDEQQQDVGVFALLEHKEPIDEIYQFMKTHKDRIPHSFGSTLFRNVCDAVPCTRSMAVVWRKDIWIDGELLKQIIILEGEEPADAIFNQLSPRLNVSKNIRDSVLKQAYDDGILISRIHALLFERSINLSDVQEADGTTKVVTFQYYESGEEPIDVLWNFAKEHNLSNDIAWDQLSQGIVMDLCNTISCNRVQPVVWSTYIQVEEETSSFTNNDDVTGEVKEGAEGALHQNNATTIDAAENDAALSSSSSPRNLGIIAIMKDQEVIDVVDAFCVTHSLSNEYRTSIFNAACEDEWTTCTRTVPIVFSTEVRFPISKDEKANERILSLGMFQIYENELLKDAIDRFFFEDGAENKLLEYNFTIDVVYQDIFDHISERVCSDEKFYSRIDWTCVPKKINPITKGTK